MTVNVVVLGGKGLVGSHLAEVAPHWFYASREINPLDERSWSSILPGDIVVDLVPPALPREEQGKGQDNYIKHKLRFMEWCSQRKLTRYVFLSSGGAIYGRHSTGDPISEERELSPVSVYGLIKKQEEQKLADLVSLSSISLRVGNIYPRLMCRPGRGGFIAAAVRSLVENKTMALFGDLTITKHFISADDVASAIILAVNSKAQGAFNIAGSRAHSLREVAEEVENQFSRKISWENKAMLENDVPWFVLDIQKAKRELGFEPKIDLPGGIHALLKEWKLA